MIVLRPIASMSLSGYWMPALGDLIYARRKYRTNMAANGQLYI